MTPSPPTTVPSGGVDWLTPSLLIAVLALLFTVASFWWLNARRGSVRAYRPYSYAATFKANEILITLPLVFHNDGAAPIVVQDLCLRLEHTGSDPTAKSKLPLQLWWRGTRPEVQPREGARPLPAAFPVAGRAATSLCIEFGRRNPGFQLGPAIYRAVVEAKFGHRDRWEQIVAFELHAKTVEATNGYIAYSNNPEWQG